MTELPLHQDHHARRQARNREFLHQALQDPNPLQANIGGVQADLLDMAAQFKEDIDRALTEGTPLSELTHEVSIWLNVQRQVARFLPYTTNFLDDKESS